MVRTDQNGERGGSKLNLLITLLIMGAMAFAAVKIVPVYVANYQFQDSHRERIALRAHRLPEEDRG